MKRVLVLNEGNSNNLGDRAINECLTYLLEQNNCKVDFVDFVGLEFQDIRPSLAKNRKSNFKNFLRRIVPFSIRKFYGTIRWFIKLYRLINNYKSIHYDLILIGGGQLILSNFYFPASMFLWVNKLKNNSSKKLGIGIGAVNKFRKIDKFLYKKGLSKLDNLYLRDKGSQKIIENEFKLSSEYIPDVAFYISKIYKSENKHSKRVLIGIIDYSVFKLYNGNVKSENDYLLEWEKEVIDYANKGFIVELFYTTPEDNIQSEKLKSNIEKKHKINLNILQVEDLRELALEISNSNVIISGRMHALIIGLSYGIKVIPYEVSNKIKIFNNEYIKQEKNIIELQEEIKITIQKIVNEI